MDATGELGFCVGLHMYITPLIFSIHKWKETLDNSSTSAEWLYFWGLLGSMVPIDLAVSGPPSGFLLFSLDSWMGIECLVGVLDTPACLEEISPCFVVSAWEKPGLAGAP